MHAHAPLDEVETLVARILREAPASMPQDLHPAECRAAGGALRKAQHDLPQAEALPVRHPCLPRAPTRSLPSARRLQVRL